MKKINSKDRKAQFFSLIAILIIVLIFFSYEVLSILYERNAIKTRITTMNTFLFSIEEDLSRKIYIFGYRTIFVALDEITRTGTYISDIDDLFNEAFFNGTVNSQNSSILYGTTYHDIIDDINNKAKKINVNINFFDASINASQTDPWTVTVTFEANFTMEDNSGLASWRKYEKITAPINIEGFEDPLYTVKTNALVVTLINKTIYEGVYVVNGDTTNLTKHINNKLYAENTAAPSFLKRLTGNLTSDANGIESLVKRNDLPNGYVKDKSLVDYIYFSTSDPANCQIQGMANWVRLDSESSNHLDKYNATCI